MRGEAGAPGPTTCAAVALVEPLEEQLHRPRGGVQERGRCAVERLAVDGIVPQPQNQSPHRLGRECEVLYDLGRFHPEADKYQRRQHSTPVLAEEAAEDQWETGLVRDESQGAGEPFIRDLEGAEVPPGLTLITGACLALPLVQIAARVLIEIATFDQAGVTDKDCRSGVGSSVVPVTLVGS